MMTDTDKGDRIDLAGTNITKCNNCSAPIVFLVSKRTGKKYPTDVSEELGQIVTYRAAFHSKSCANPPSRYA